jgi:hypothetical protein
MRRIDSMAMFFNRRNKTGAPDATRALSQTIRTYLGLGEDDGLSVSEIACSHPECGDAETIVLIMRAGQKTEAVKIAKAARLVGQDDIDAQLAAFCTASTKAD